MGENFFKGILGDFLEDNGVIHQSSCVDGPQKNGLAERKKRHLLVVARALMFTTKVPKHFLGEGSINSIISNKQITI